MATTPEESTLGRIINVDQTHPILLMCYDPADGKWYPVKGTKGVLSGGGGGGGAVTDGDYGDIVVSLGGTVWTVDADAINTSKLGGDISLVGKAFLTAGTVAGQKTLLALIKADVGLSDVDNTTDVNKPVSTAQASAISAAQSFAVSRANHTGTQLASTISDLPETIDDRVAALLVAGANISLVYDDLLGTLTVSGTGGGGGGGNSFFATTLTVPSATRYSELVVAAIGCTPTSKIICDFAGSLDSENDAENIHDDRLSLYGIAQTDSIKFVLISDFNFVGPFNINYGFSL